MNLRVRARSLYIYNTRVRKNTITKILDVLDRRMKRNGRYKPKNQMLIFNVLQRKCNFCAFFLQKYLVISKKSSTFALAFEKQVCFDFLPESGH